MLLVNVDVIAAATIRRQKGRSVRHCDALLIVTILNVEADGAHQGQRVAARDDTRAHLIIEFHHAVFQVVFKMNIGGARAERIHDFGQRQIVR